MFAQTSYQSKTDTRICLILYIIRSFAWFHTVRYSSVNSLINNVECWVKIAKLCSFFLISQCTSNIIEYIKLSNYMNAIFKVRISIANMSIYVSIVFRTLNMIRFYVLMFCLIYVYSPDSCWVFLFFIDLSYGKVQRLHSSFSDNIFGLVFFS